MITFSKTTADRILQLRHQVLRPGLPVVEVIFPEDQNQDTQNGCEHHCDDWRKADLWESWAVRS